MNQGAIHYNYFRDYDPAIGRYLESDLFGIEAGINTFGYVHASPLVLVDPFGAAATSPDPYPNCPRTPDGAMCRALGPSNSTGGPISGTGNLSLNVQLGRIGIVPVGIALSCNIGPNGLSDFYVGMGFVSNTGGGFSSFAGRAGLSSQSGNAYGLGARGNVTFGAAAAGMGGSASLFLNCLSCKRADDGWAANAGVGLGSGPSSSFTFGYRWR